MNTTGRTMIMQRWRIVQQELIPGLGEELECLTPPLEKLIHVLDWVRIEEWAGGHWCGIGRRPHDRGALANAFVAKVVFAAGSGVAADLRVSAVAEAAGRGNVFAGLRRICPEPVGGAGP